jgi:hypothetical protein
MQLLDAYSSSIEDIGVGALGAHGGAFALVGPGWKGTLAPETVKIESPTPRLVVIGRTGVDGFNDLPAVRALQDRYRLAPLSQYGSPPQPITLAHKSESAHIEFPKGLGFFSELDAAMRNNPFHRWALGGAIAAGAAIGVLAVGTAVAWAPPPPQPGLCWCSSDPSQRNGFWDTCP